MKRLLSAVVTLAMVSAASAVTTVTLVPIEEGEPGSPSNPLQPSDEIIVWVTSDTGLFGLDCILTITSGPATITGAMGDSIIMLPGVWPPGGVAPPIIDPDGKRAEISAGAFEAPPSGIVGWFRVQCDGQGIITVELSHGYTYGGSMDINYGLPNIFGTLVIDATTTTTTVTLVPIEEGERGSLTNPLQPSDEITIWVTSDGVLAVLEARLDVTSGAGTIVDAVKPSDCAQYGWDPGLSGEPIIEGSYAEIALVSWTGAGPGTVGYFTLRCDAEGVVVVELTEGWGIPPPEPPYYVYGRLEIYVTAPATYYVNSADGNDLNDGLTPEAPFETIQKGIDEADDDATVLVYPGVYTEALDFLGKAITVQSIDEPAVLRAPSYYAVSFYHGEDANSILKNFVIKDSHAGLFFYGASPTIRNVTVVDNVAGAWADGGANPDISSSIFWDNWGADLGNCEAAYSFARREIGAGLLAYWKFDKGSGTVAYDWAGPHHGTLMNGPTWTTGPVGGALEFDDVDDYVDIGDQNSLDFGGEDSFSIAAWIKTDADGPIVYKRRCGGTGGVYHEGYATKLLAGKLYFAIEDVAGSGVSIHANTVVTDDQWHHVTAVRDASLDTLHLYLDGSSDATPVADPTSESLATSRALEIARSDSTVAPGLSHFGGRIDDVRIYDRPLDVNEIRQLYWNGLGPLFADPNSGDYHLLSERGRYRASTDEWILDDVTSICVDGGDPAIEPSNERMPNGGRINMGAYGNTPYASMSEWSLQGDITRDGRLDWQDIALVGGQWLAELDWAP